MHFRTWALFIARRYLAPARRNRFIGFITLIATLGVMFGTTALLVSLAILDGFDKTLRSNMISFMGHIEVTSIKQGSPLTGYRDVVANLPTLDPQVTNVSPFVRREGIIRSKAGLEGILVKGIDAGTDLSTIRNRIVAGTFDLPEPAPGGLPTIVIGQRLGAKLKLKPGDTALVFAPNGTPSPDNPAGIEQFVVGGLYRTGMAEHDDIYTYTSLATAQRLWKYQDDQITGYDILIRDVDSVAETAQRIRVALGYPHFSQTFYDIFAPFFAWLDLQRVPIPIVLTLISIVAVFNIVSTLLIMILEKTESIGVLTTLGAGPGGAQACGSRMPQRFMRRYTVMRATPSWCATALMFQWAARRYCSSSWASGQCVVERFCQPLYFWPASPWRAARAIPPSRERRLRPRQGRRRRPISPC